MEQLTFQLTNVHLTEDVDARDLKVDILYNNKISSTFKDTGTINYSFH